MHQDDRILPRTEYTLPTLRHSTSSSSVDHSRVSDRTLSASSMLSWSGRTSGVGGVLGLDVSAPYIHALLPPFLIPPSNNYIVEFASSFLKALQTIKPRTQYVRTIEDMDNNGWGHDPNEHHAETSNEGTWRRFLLIHSDVENRDDAVEVMDALCKMHATTHLPYASVHLLNLDEKIRARMSSVRLICLTMVEKLSFIWLLLLTKRLPQLMQMEHDRRVRPKSTPRDAPLQQEDGTESESESKSWYDPRHSQQTSILRSLRLALCAFMRHLCVGSAGAGGGGGGGMVYLCPTLTPPLSEVYLPLAEDHCKLTSWFAGIFGSLISIEAVAHLTREKLKAHVGAIGYGGAPFPKLPTMAGQGGMHETYKDLHEEPDACRYLLLLVIFMYYRFACWSLLEKNVDHVQCIGGPLTFIRYVIRSIIASGPSTLPSSMRTISNIIAECKNVVSYGLIRSNHDAGRRHISLHCFHKFVCRDDVGVDGMIAGLAQMAITLYDRQRVAKGKRHVIEFDSKGAPWRRTRVQIMDEHNLTLLQQAMTKYKANQDMTGMRALLLPDTYGSVLEAILAPQAQILRIMTQCLNIQQYYAARYGLSIQLRDMVHPHATYSQVMGVVQYQHSFYALTSPWNWVMTRVQILSLNRQALPFDGKCRFGKQYGQLPIKRKQSYSRAKEAQHRTTQRCC